jgi:hypothetical protein
MNYKGKWYLTYKMLKEQGLTYAGALQLHDRLNNSHGYHYSHIANAALKAINNIYLIEEYKNTI